MRYLKRFNESLEYINKVREEGDLKEIIFIIENSDLIDEFDNRIFVSDWYSSKMSESLENGLSTDHITKEEYDYLIKNTFTIRLEERQDESDQTINWSIPDQIHWIEPKIWSVIREINSRIESLGYKVLHSDFGSNDVCYELLIGDKSYNLNEISS